MTERIVTAVVVLTGTAQVARVRETTAALHLQTRRPDHLLAIAPAAPEADLAELLESARRDDDLDEVLRATGSTGVSAVVREILDRCAADRGDDSSAPTEETSGTTRSESTSPSDTAPDTDPEPHRGRRQRAVDPERERRRMLREAADEASIPLRLRKDSGSVGHRPSARRAAQGEDWIWFLEEDSAPGQGALAALIDQAASSPNAAVIGPKHVRHRRRGVAPEHADGSDGADASDGSDEQDIITADDADGLVDVGLTLTHGGRIVTGVDAGEIDQGQSDWREDVLAVSFSGMLVRQDTLERLDGFDPALESPWAEIDFCRRTWRGGERVAIATAARAIGASAEISGAADPVGYRRGQLLAIIKHRPLVIALLTLLWLPVLTVARMAGAIITHRPRQVGIELLAWLSAMAATPRILRRGLRASRRARVPRRRLAPLLLPRGADLRRKLDDLWTRAFADDERSRRIRRTTWGISGTTHGADDADYGRHVTWTLLVVLLAGIGGALVVRPLLSRGRLIGPQLAALPENWRETAQAAWSGWIPGGLGSRGPADPLVRLLGHLPLPGPVLIEILVLGAIPLSALVAWWAAGALTRAIGARLALALAWAAAPPLLASLRTGDWPLLLVHLLLPLLALAVGRAIGLVHKISQASVAAAAGAGLLLLVIGAVQPVLVLLVGLALAALAPLVPGRRLRLLWVLVPSLALHAPYLPHYLAHPRSVLAAAGNGHVGPLSSPLQLLALWPAPAPSWDALTPLLGAQAAGAVPLLVLVPFALTAVLAPFLFGAAGRAGRLGLLVAAAALGLALFVRTVATRVDGEATVPAPTGALLSVAMLGLLLAAGSGFDALARRNAATSSLRRSATTVLAAALALSCLITVGGWTLTLPHVLQVQRERSAAIPAAATDPGLSQARSRVLVLDGTGSGQDAAVGAELVVGGGDTLTQHAAARDARTIAAGGTAEDPGSAAVLQASSDLVSSGSAPSPEALRSLAVAYVAVPGGSARNPDLAGALDGSALLEKVTENQHVALWRVIDAAPRVGVAAAAPEDLGAGTEIALVPSRSIAVSGQHVNGSDTERTLLLAERRDAGWTATLDGKRLDPVQVDDWQQAWEIPAGASGDLEINHRPPFTLALRIGLYVVVLVTALVAVPWRSRLRTTEDLR